MDKLRRVYRKEVGVYGEIIWNEILFGELKKGDIFRLQDPDGTYVKYEGNINFSALGDAYINPETGIGEVQMWI